MKIKYLPHTADIRMFIEEETLQKLFKAGVKGMANILKENICDHTYTFNSKTRIKTTSSKSLVSTPKTSAIILYFSKLKILILQ
jgi:SHS2 domain-containing protein